jgi:hypothetical protein
VDDVQVMRGMARSWRWRREAAGATGSGADTGGRDAEQGSRAGARGRRRGEGVRGTSLEFAKISGTPL